MVFWGLLTVTQLGEHHERDLGMYSVGDNVGMWEMDGNGDHE